MHIHKVLVLEEVKIWEVLVTLLTTWRLLFFKRGVGSAFAAVRRRRGRGTGGRMV